MVNGRVDPDFNAFQREKGKRVAPDFNFATSAYLFDKNQLFIRWTELRQDSAKDESTTKAEAIKWWNTRAEKEPRYCPNCGAKVVE